mgnify:CR=1 FL=1
MIDDVHLSNPNRSAESAPRASAGGGGCVFGASKVVSLGSITKSYSADINDTQKRRGLTIRRFALKAVSSNILPDSRTAKCMRWRAPNSQVEVWRGVSAGVAGKAFYKGLFVCGSLWLCPVCAAKISERRRVELSIALNSARAQGFKVMLLTQTIRHGFGDSLSGAFKGIAAAEKRLWSSRSGAAVRERLGVVGTIKTTEVTWGSSNGWHPHKHTLLILKAPISPSVIQSELSPLWINACVKSGLPAPTRERGLTVLDGSFADKYVSKWGLESEMTKGHSKIAKAGGMTPFALVENVLETGDAQSWALFQEYDKALKGKRQLVWSKGLRALLLQGVAEKSDEELANEEDPDVQAVFWASLSVQEWKAILHYKYRAVFLAKCEDCSPEIVQAWLNDLTACFAEERDGYITS